jgi:glucokinase
VVSEVEKFLGIDVGGGSLKASLIDKEGKVYQEEAIQTDRFWDNPTFLTNIHFLIEKFQKTSFVSIGIGTPGPIDIPKGSIIRSANLPNLSNLSLIDSIASQYKVPIHFNNDANCAALGSYFFNKDAQVESLVVITLGTGYGCGWVLNGKIFNGYLGNGMEAGHQTVITNGALCGCGQRGCVEAYFSTRGLLERFREKTNISLSDGKAFFKLIERKDEDAQDILSLGIEAFSNSIRNIIHLLNPNKIILVGGLTKSKDLFFDRVTSDLDQIVFPVLRSHSKVIIGESIAGSLGAAALGF